MTHWTTDAGSVAILGHTQTGKTVLARQLHDQTGRLSIWVNSRGKLRVPDIAGQQYQSLKGVVKGMSRNERTFNLLGPDPKENPEAARSLVADLTDRLMQWADNSDRQLRMQVTVDEMHNIAPQSGKEYGNLPGRDDVRDLTSEGQKREIKFVGLTQDPVRMDKQTLRQTEYTVLFHNHFTQEDSLERLNIPFEEAQDLPEHHFVVLGARGQWVVAPPGMKADARYA